MNTTIYRRVIIEGSLTTRSDLQIGAVHDELPGSPGEPAGKGIMRDANGQPYIPGSSLRGVLAAEIRRATPHHFKKLFGEARLTTKEKAGILRVFDATLPTQTSSNTIQRTRVSIDPVTRTAKDKHLIHEDVLRRGTCFQITIQADDIDQQALDALLHALNRFTGKADGLQLGGGKSIGRGHIQWQQKQIRVLDEPAFQQWLDGDQPLSNANWQLHTPPAPGAAITTQSWRLLFHFDEPLLINDPAEVTDQPEAPRLCYRRHGDKLLVPGSSIKGVFRARARRILITISNNPNVADQLIGKMFGSTENASRWRFHDLTTHIERKHEQTLIAIDRFTGGVQDQALLNLEAAIAKPAITTIVADNPPDWQKALWYLILRDAIEGDLNLGWGAARGFGAFHIGVLDDKITQPWKQLQQQMNEAWFDALDEKIQQHKTGDIA